MNHKLSRIVEEFTSAWESGQRPWIAEFVSQIEAVDKQPLLQALIPLDIKFLRQQNQSVTADAYTEFGAEAVQIAKREISSKPDDVDSEGTLMFDSKQSSADDSFLVNQSVLTNLGQTIDIVPKVVLRDPDEAEPNQVAQPSSSGLTDSSSIGRYELHGEIARGGMGAILKGHDTDLGRDLAIKVLLEEQKDRPDVVQRFIEEAQIGGQLQHPGIAPVYELGQFADKRPFFSMKLVKGETLSVLLKDRDDFVKDRAKFLGIFEQICQTMAYAHSRGVIHRDLKPANIMVGAFGEVQVMDWGLAKVLSDGEIPEKKKTDPTQSHDTIIQTLRRGTNDAPIGLSGSGSGGSNTQMGSVMGTPAYMPPEQALGEIDRLDERADVFGLGAILCEILTGKPPYIGDDITQVFRLASRGKLDACFDRLESSDAGPELVAITKLCLEPEPDDRPADASVLSDRISSYLASVETRLREAELEGASQAVRLVEERKRRRVTVILGVVGAAFIACAGIGAFILQQNRAAIADANLKNEIATLQRDQQLAALAEKAKQAVNSELAIGQSLLVESSGAEEPNEYTLRRLQETADRANTLLSSDLRETELGKQTSELFSRTQQLESIAKLVADLEELRITDLETSMQQTWQNIYSSDRQVREIETRILGTNRIRDAWKNWGVTSSSSATEFGIKLQQVPPWAKPSLIDSLYVWDHSLKGLDRFANAARSDWHPLILAQGKSSGGAVLTKLADESILASGVNPQGDVYELTFKTDLKSFNTLQIEALTHPSLPRNGPGRGVNGDAIANDMEVFCRPSESPELARKIEIAAAEADYSYYSGVKATSWNISGGPNKSRRKFHYFTEPLSASENCEIVVRFKGNTGDNWGDRNLGCFRISVALIEDDSNELTREWIANVLTGAQVLPWTTELWSAIQDQDVPKMVQLAQSPDAKLASDIDVLRLAGEIWLHGEAVYLNRLRTNYDWQDIELKSLSNASGIKLEKDGSFFAAGPQYPRSDVFRIEIEDVQATPTAFWLETMEDKRLPDNGPGTHAGPDGCVISEVSFWNLDRTPNDGNRNLESTRMPIAQVVSDTRRVSGYFPENAIDEQTATLWQPRHPKNTKSCTTLFRLGDSTTTEFVPPEVSVHIYSGAVSAVNRILGRFRLRYTTEDLSATVDPRLEAMALLRAVYSNQPDNYRLLLAMSLMSPRDTPESRTMSRSFAASAVALRPSKDSSLEVFANATLAHRPAPDDPWLNLLIDIAKSNPSETSQRVLDAVCDQQIELGKNNESIYTAKSKQAFLKAIEINSERVFADQHSHRALARMYLRYRDFEKAEHHAVSAIALNPLYHYSWDHLGQVRWYQNRFPDAAECFRLGLALQRGSNLGRVFRKKELMRLQHYSDLLKTIDDEALWRGRRTLDDQIPRGLALAETGDLEASRDWFFESFKRVKGDRIDFEFLRLVQLTDSKPASIAEYRKVIKDLSRSKFADDVMQSFLFKPNRNAAPTVHQIAFEQVIATELAEIRDTDINYWATAALADLSAEDWEKARAAVDRMIELRGEANSIDLTLLAICDWKLGEFSDLEAGLKKAAKDGAKSLDTKQRHLLALTRLKLSGMLAADPDDQAFMKSLEFLLMFDRQATLPRRSKFSGEWYWNRIFSGWLLREGEEQVRQAFEEMSSAGPLGTDRAEDLARVKPWIDARFGRFESVIADLEAKFADLDRSYIDMLFLAKALSDAGRPEDAARAVFESRSLFDLEWHPDQPNKHLQPEMKWAYTMAQKQLEALETVLPKYEPDRPELKYLATAKAWLETRPEPQTATPEPDKSNLDTFEQAYLNEDWATIKEIALRAYDPQRMGIRTWLKAAAAISLTQDRDSYIDFCEKLLQARSRTSTPNVAETVCKACLLMPNAIDLNALPDNVFTTRLDDDSANRSMPWFWGTRALLQFRSGAFSDSLASVEKAQQYKPTDYLPGLLLAVKCMALHRSGQKEKYDVTVTEMNQVFKKWQDKENFSHRDFLAAEVLRREAIAMGANEPTDAK